MPFYSPESTLPTIAPLCPVFGTCGGCAYQDLPYEEELRIKEDQLKALFHKELQLDEDSFESIVASPESYHYRSRLDLGIRKTRKGEFFMGFMPENGRRIVEVESCAIARKEISDFMPLLKEQARAKLPPDYDVANLVIKTGDDGRIFWGGIGRRSLEMKEENYFWTEVCGRRICYSLDTFFQANLAILPLLIERIKTLVPLDQKTLFLDLYGGVGLFGISLADSVKKVMIIEDSPSSAKLAQYNRKYHGLEDKVEIRTGRVEAELPAVWQSLNPLKTVALIDPPRKGLSPSALETTAQIPGTLLYLSCYPLSLVRDLKVFIEKGWQIKKVIPFDFFPRTKHIETLVLLDHDE